MDKGGSCKGKKEHNLYNIPSGDIHAKDDWKLNFS